MRILGVELAPLNVPLERRLQTGAVFLQVAIFFFLGLFSATFLFLLIFTPFFWISYLYLAWYVYDFNRSSQGGRKLPWIKHLRYWQYFRDYFPIRMIKTGDLDPSHSYIIGHHPHGILSFGGFCNFVTDANNFSQLYPGIETHLLSLRALHYLPIQREYYMALGVCDVSKDSIRYLTKQPGHAVVIIIGGAREAFFAAPGESKLVLKNRKGFVRMALQTGAHLVPAFSFGENDVYRLATSVENDTRLARFQKRFQQLAGFAPVLFIGRGIFNYTFGLVPYRKPITTVVGKPIPVEQIEEPSQEQVDKLHQRYMDELHQLFEDHKAECGYPNGKLEFIYG